MVTMRLAILLFFALPLLSTGAVASACDTAQTQSENEACAALDLQQADAELNGAYAELKSGYAKLGKLQGKLVEAQRAWLKYRDAECAMVVFPNLGTTAEAVVRSQCLANLTRQRLTDIRVKLACQEGDLTCAALGDAAD
jgi:uncharacterized protein YecT (DUF1311 family)